MVVKYQPREFEEKWRDEWKKEKLYSFQFLAIGKKDKKFYNLVELPYTSGDLHIGHWFTFTVPDVLARYKRMNGYDVFFPIGYDAFGLPAENAAIKRGIHPKDWTLKNIENMTKQFQTMGTMLNNWDDVVVTCLPEYYRWNQWIFLKMYERGLAYRGKALSNWCPSCQTVLANENIENGKCWRCGSIVIQKEVEQWFLKITNYADRLLWKKNADYAYIDWPKQVQVGQNNWIGRKEGINITYKVVENNNSSASDFFITRESHPSTSLRVPSKVKKNPIASPKYIDEITCFTTRPDTNFGATFIVIAPEHPFVEKILSKKILSPSVIPRSEATRNLANPSAQLRINSVSVKKIKDYVGQAKRKTEEQRKIEAKKKTGIFTGFYAANDLNGRLMPIWVSDFVLMNVGTGAVVGVPGHDLRDFEFAKEFGLVIVRVVVGKDGDKSLITKAEQVQEEEGTMINSDFLDGMDIHEATKTMMDYLEKKGWGKRTVTYHLRDWSISRQRYWGTPVPMIHCRNCGVVPVPEKDLPVELPYEVDFTPKGKPPLATNEKWVNVKCPKCGSEAKRDAETLDTFFDSSWYWYRYVSPRYTKGPFPTAAVGKLTPVDVYFGGAEHTLGHTLYARFFTKFFHDLGLVDYEEFALKRVQHGVVLGPDGYRMSKSRGNVVNPDDQVMEYGADTVRLYLCFMMPYGATAPWSDKTIAGVNRFLNRVWKMYQLYKDSATQFFITRESHPDGTVGVPSKVKKIASASSKNSNKTMKQLSNVGEDKQLVSKLQKTIRKVSNDIEKLKMNTAIAAMMELLKHWETVVKSQFPNPNFQPNSKSKIQNKNNNQQSTINNCLSPNHAKDFLKILAPFAPFTTEEIWRSVFGEKESIHLSDWPKVDKKALVEEMVKIPVQVNGKVRSVISLSVGQLSEKSVIEKALEDEKVKKYLKGKKYRAIYVKEKILNFLL